MRLAVNAWFWDHPTAGSGQYTRRLVEHLTILDPGLDVRLVLPNLPKGWGYRAVRFPPPVSRLAQRTAGNLHKVWFEQVAFPRACRELGADVAHTPYWAPPMSPTVPTVVTIHDLIPLLLREYRGGPAVRLYTALVSTTAQNSALVLTDSTASKRDIVTHLGLSEERVRVVHLAADERYTPTPGPDDADVRARYGLPERYALYLGGFDVRKNIATALEAYRWVGPAVGDDCPLVIAGRLPERDTPFTPDPRRLARELDVEGWVDCIGFVEEPDKPALYRGATAFVFPSRYEGFGLPPLEALACGTPVVGSDAASLPEVMGDAGVLLSPDDGAGIAGALIQLAIDEAFRAELSRRALRQASNFSWERTAHETLSALQDDVAMM